MKINLAKFILAAAMAGGGAATAATTISCLPLTGPAGLGTDYSSTCTASGGVAPYTWSISSGSLPAGITMSGTTGTSINIGGTPSSPGPYSYTVRVVDSTAPTPVAATQTYSGAITSALAVNCTPATGPSRIGVPYSTTCTASGGRAPYAWSISSGPLPGGLNLSATTGTTITISGTPILAALFGFTVRVTDSSVPSQVATQVFSGTITPLLLDVNCTPGTGPSAVGTPYSATCTASGGAPPYAWSISAGSLPPGVTLSATTGTSITVSGTPTSPGAYSYTVRVTDNTTQSSTQPYSGTVAPPALGVNCTPVTGPTSIGAPYSATCTASGGVSPFTWSISPGALPAGITLSATTGTSITVSGTPTSPGAYSYTVRVADSAAQAATRAYSGTVAAPSLTVNCTPNTGPTSVGAPYSATCTSSGGVAPFTWSISPGALPAGITLSANTGTSITVSGTPTTPGAYGYTVRVADSAAQAATQAYSGTVAPPSLTVNCTPGTGPTSVGTPYSATCTASGGIAPFTWSISPGSLPAGVTLSATTGASVTVSGTPTTPGAYSYTVRVADSAAQAATQPYSGTVAPPGLTVNCTPGTGPTSVGTPYSATCTASGGVAPFTWSISQGSLPAGVTLSATTGTSITVSGTPTTPGAYSYTVRVADSAAQAATQPYSGTVAPPGLTVNCTPGTGPASVGAPYSATCTASGGVSPFTWSISQGSLPAGVTLSATSGTSITVSGTPTTPGAYSYTVRVADSAAQAATQAYSGTVAPPGLTVNCTPGTGPASVGAPYSATCTASGGVAPFTWSIGQGSLPAGVTLSATSGTSITVSGTPTTPGAYSYTVRVADSAAQAAAQAYSGTVAPPGLTVNCTPGAGPTSVGAPYSATCTASGGVAPFVWSISSGSLPAGVTLSATTGSSITVGGTPTTAGAYSYTVQVADNAGQAATQAYSGNVAPPGLTVNCTPGTGPASVGAAYSATCTASGGVSPLTWSISPGSLPAGITLSASTGTSVSVSGTPTTAGPYSYTVRVADSAGQAATQAYSGTIAPPGLTVNCTPITGPASVGAPYSATCTASGGVSPFTWSVGQGSLPAGITLSATTGTSITVSGTPTAAGVFGYTVRVVDSAAQGAAQAYSGTISPQGLTVNCTPGTGPVTVGVAYTATCSATGGTPPFSWSINPGSLPAGISLLSTSGTSVTIGGTPTAAGPYSYGVRVADSTSQSAAQPYSGAIAGPSITVNCAPAAGPAAFGVAYSTTCTASGGTQPFTWSISPGSLPAGIALSGTTGTSVTVSGSPSATGPYSYTVRVTDAANQSATQTFSGNVAAPELTVNCTPTAGPATVGAAYAATCTASGGIAPYSWLISAGALPAGLTLNIINATSATISGTATTAAAYSYTVRVTDSATPASQSATQAFSGSIAPPTLTLSCSTADGPARVGATYTATCTATGGTAPYTWSISAGTLPAGLALTATTGASINISGAATATGAYNYTVQVRDAASPPQSAAKTYTGNVATPGLTVTCSPNTGPATVGVAYSTSCAASGGIAPYSWSISAGTVPAGVALRGSTGASVSINGTPSAAGSYDYTIRVTDSGTPAQSATQNFSGTVAPPALTVSCTPATGPTAVGTTYSSVCTAAGGLPPYTWSISPGALPAGVTLGAATATTITINGIPTVAAGYNYTVRVTDSSPIPQAATQAFSGAIGPAGLTVSCTPATGPTVAGTQYTTVCTAIRGTPPYSWNISAGALPAGLALGQASGNTVSILGAPTAAGAYNFTVRVQDSSSPQQSATQSFTGTIAQPTLNISCTQAATAAVGGPYSLPCTAAGGSPPYTWAISTGTLPPGLALSATSGTSVSIIGTPTSAGNFDFTVRLTDSTGAAATRPVTLSVTAGLTITNAPLAAGVVGGPYSQTLTAGGGTSPYTWSLSSGTLPPGLTLSTGGVIAGTPTSTGTFQVTAQVRDAAAATATREFTITISTGLTITTPSSLPSGALNVAYSQTLAAAGGISPYTWSISSGLLPVGMSLDSASGALTGRPSATGTFLFAAAVTDSASARATRDFVLVVAAGPAISAPSSLNNALAGSAYAETMTAGGGTPPYTWSIARGTLPDGLTLNSATGSISGTAIRAGTFPITAQVSDSNQLVATRDYSLVVDLPPVSEASFRGVPDSTTAAQQLAIGISLAAGYPIQITGLITLSFRPDAAVPSDDPAIQFSTGGRSVNFAIPANSTEATFSVPQLGIQTGTVAGTIDCVVTWQAGGINLPVPPTLVRSMRVSRTGPVVRTVRVVRVPAGFEVRITAFSPSRDLTQATLRFGGRDLQTTELTVSLADSSKTWYEGPASAQFGSQFVLVLPFNVSGDATAVQSVTVSLANAAGASAPVTTDF